MAAMTLRTEDYVVFGITLAISAVIGIYFGIKDRRAQAGIEGYMMAGRSMHVIPVAFSLCVSFLSAVTVLGTPAEFYNYGTMYWWFVPMFLIVSVIIGEIFIPVFHRLQISSTFEYLEKRFSNHVRMVATATYVIQTALYMGIVIYAPSLALNAVTGFTLWGSVAITGVVCIFYTTLGGMKAVIWTDVFQAIVMLTGMLAILIKGSIQLGGFENIWKIAKEGKRTEFLYFDFDPRYRYTVWTIMFGGTFLSLGGYIKQTQVQRYLSCKSVNEAKAALYLNWIGTAVFISLSMMNGAVAYAFYHDCDPIKSNKIRRNDQILPYLALELFQDQAGLPGLIVASVFSGSLSTVSSSINAMACVVVQDFIKPVSKWSDKTYTWISKGLVFAFGGLSILIAYLASQLGGILEATLSVLSLVSGPLLGIFTLGLMFPFANSWGGMFGFLAGLSTTVWVYIGKRTYPADVTFTRRLPVSTDGCPSETYNTTYVPTTSITMTSNESTTLESLSEYPAIADFYAVSYLYYSFLGFTAVMIIGLIISLLTGGWKTRKEVDPCLLHFFFDHQIFAWLPKSFRKMMRCGVPQEDEKSHMVESLHFRNLSDNEIYKNKGIPMSSNDGYTNVAYEKKKEDKDFGDENVTGI